MCSRSLNGPASLLRRKLDLESMRPRLCWFSPSLKESICRGSNLVRHFIQQWFCENAFTVHHPVGRSLGVGCGVCREKSVEAACWPGRQALAGSSQASLMTKGHEEVIAPQSCWGGSDCDRQPLLIAFELITHWPTGTLVAPCSPLHFAHAGQPPSFAPCSEQASGRGPMGTPVPFYSKTDSSEETRNPRVGEDQFLSAWQKPGDEALLPLTRRKQQRRDKGKKTVFRRKVMTAAKITRKLDFWS